MLIVRDLRRPFKAEFHRVEGREWDSQKISLIRYWLPLPHFRGFCGAGPRQTIERHTLVDVPIKQSYKMRDVSGVFSSCPTVKCCHKKLGFKLASVAIGHPGLTRKEVTAAPFFAQNSEHQTIGAWT